MIFGKSRKHEGKMLVSAFSPFLTMFSKIVYLRVVKSLDCAMKELKHEIHHIALAAVDENVSQD